MLPKLIVVVPEDSLINAVNNKSIKFGISEYYGQVIEYLMTEMTDTIDEFKSLLPAKMKKNRPGWPFILWMAPSLHTSYEEHDHLMRRKFTKCLEKIARNNKNTAALRLKNSWDKQDKSLFDGSKFTPAGWNAYWQSMDQAVKYFDEYIMPSFKQASEARKFTLINNKPEDHLTYGSYHREREDRRRNRVELEDRQRPRDRDGTRRRTSDEEFLHGFRRLPTPPPKK